MTLQDFNEILDRQFGRDRWQPIKDPSVPYAISYCNRPFQQPDFLIATYPIDYTTRKFEYYLIPEESIPRHCVFYPSGDHPFTIHGCECWNQLAKQVLIDHDFVQDLSASLCSSISSLTIVESTKESGT
jgi:hypothetical protein